MQFGILDIILLVWGIYTLFGVVFRPAFFWERGRIRRTRDIIGDRRTAVLHLVLAGVMIGVGLWGALQ